LELAQGLASEPVQELALASELALETELAQA
jgi:hypothetical protein